MNKLIKNIGIAFLLLVSVIGMAQNSNYVGNRDNAGIIF